jgi:hypothetical protein
MVSKTMPFGLDFNYMYLNGAAFVDLSPPTSPRKDSGMGGIQMFLPFLPGYGYKDTGIGHSFPNPGTSSSGVYFVSAKVSTGVTGAFLAFFNGYAKATTMLRLRVSADGKDSTVENYLWFIDGPAGISFPTEDKVLDISAFIKCSPQGSITVMVDMIQTLTAIGTGSYLINACFFRVREINVTAVPQSILSFLPWL